MSVRRRALGRGLDDLTHASFSALVESPPREPALPDPAATDPATLERPEAGTPQTAGPLRMCAVTGGKGGTGKSVVAANLGVLLARGAPATVLDADFCLSNIHMLYGLTPVRTAAHLMTGEARLEEVMIEGPAGTRLISGGFGVPEMAGLPAGMLRQLAGALAPLEPAGGWLIVDTPAGLERQSLLFLLAADLVLVVTTEDITALADAYAVIKTLRAHRPDAAPVVVINRTRMHDGALDAYHRLAHVARRFLGCELRLGGIVPFDEAVERSISSRAPVALAEPASEASRALASLARLFPSLAPPEERGTPASRLGRWLDGPLFS